MRDSLGHREAGSQGTCGSGPLATGRIARLQWAARQQPAETIPPSVEVDRPCLAVCSVSLSGLPLPGLQGRYQLADEGEGELQVRAVQGHSGEQAALRLVGGSTAGQRFARLDAGQAWQAG